MILVIPTIRDDRLQPSYDGMGAFGVCYKWTAYLKQFPGPKWIEK